MSPLRQDGSLVADDALKDAKRPPLRQKLIGYRREFIVSHVALYGEDFSVKDVARSIRKIWWYRHGRAVSILVGGVIGSSVGAALGFLMGVAR